MNPYAAPRGRNEPPSDHPVCARRLDVFLIVAFLGMIIVGSFVSLAIPSARNFIMPRFGWSGLNLLMFPLVFLGLYLWKPAPRLLALSGSMFLFVSALNALMIVRTGTVTTVANAYHDRLPSSYAWSVIPILALGIYLCWIAWQTRSHVLPPEN